MIQGHKVCLKLVSENEIEEVYRLLSNIENRGAYFPKTLTSFSAFKKQYLDTGFWTDQFGRFLIVDLDHNIIGSIYYFKTAIYSDALELGYLIFDPLNSGKGYMTEALQLMVNYLFSTKPMHRVQVNIDPRHTASIALAIKVGFEFEGRRKQIIYLEGKHCDLDEYVILRNQWEASKT